MSKKTLKQKAPVIFKQAVAYAAGAMSINKVLRPRYSIENYEPLPYFLCLSFSIELLLKSLLASLNIQGRGHDFINLTKELPEGELRLLEDKYFSLRNTDEIPPKDFFVELEEVKNMFVDWRYIYEKDDGYTTFEINYLLSFANALLSLCQQLHPEWRDKTTLLDIFKQ